MTDSPLLLPKEKWADDVRILSDDPAERQEIADLVRGGLPDFHGVRDIDLMKTHREAALIAEANSAINIFRAVFRLNPISFDANRCHLISPENWADHLAPHLPGSAAQSVYGHCYMQRADSLRDLAHDLTHEMAHATSYLSIEIRPLPNANPELRLRRSGFAFFRKSGTPICDFPGINEGTTELIAHHLRAILAKHTTVLSLEERRGLIDSMVYYPHVRLLQALLEEPGLKLDIKQAMGLLTLDYLTGSWRFFRKLARALPGSIRILRQVDTDSRSPLSAAEMLGLTDAAADIDYALKHGRTKA